MHLDHTRVKNTIIIIFFQIKLFDFSNEVAATVKPEAILTHSYSQVHFIYLHTQHLMW